MGNITDSESDEIQRNLERFMDEQIREYRYTQGMQGERADTERSFEEMEIEVPNLNAPKTKPVSKGVSYIDISRDSYNHRDYADDLDDDFVEYERPEPKREQRIILNDNSFEEEELDFDEEDYEYDDEEFERRKAERASRRKKKKERGRRKAKAEELEGEGVPGAGRKKKKMKKPLKIALCILIPILVLVGGAFWFVNYMIGAAYDKMTYKEAPMYTNTALTEDGVTNILLIGNDSRQNGGDGRADVMMLMTINRPQKKIYLTSFLRDTRINIPGKGENRLNASYALGGPELVMQTLSEAFDVKISRYMLVNFQAFANVGDAVGGVDMEITAKETDWINAYLWEYNEIEGRDQYADNLPEGTEGTVHLNGPQILAYCRNRYVGTDFGRTDRQKKAVSAIIKKLPGAAVTNLGGIMDGLFPSLVTSLTKDNCYSLAGEALSIKDYEIVQNTIPQDKTWENDKSLKGMALIKIDFEANKKWLHETVLSTKTS